MLIRKSKFNYLKNMLIIILAAMITSIFSRTGLSSHFVTTIVIVITMFIFMFIWYVFSTVIVQHFRYYRDYVTKHYRKYLSYGPVFSILLINLVLISIIISFSQLNIKTSFKSSASLMVASITIMSLCASLFTRYQSYLFLKKKNAFNKYLEKVVRDQKKYNDYKDINMYLLKITNKMPLQINMHHYKYDKELKKYINNINKIGLDKNSKKKLYLYLTNK